MNIRLKNPRRWIVGGLVTATMCIPASVVVAAATGPEPSAPVQERYAVSQSASADNSDAGKAAAAEAEFASTRSTGLGHAGPMTKVISTKRTVWVGPAENGLCVMTLETGGLAPNGACYPSELILRGDAWQQAAGPDGFVLTALVPNDVAAVSVTHQNGTVEKVAPQSNLLYVDDKSPVLRYQYTSGGTAFEVSTISK